MNSPELTRTFLIRTGPYRLFFPLGILAGLAGVGHWVFWSVGWARAGIGYTHASIQAQGFLACFVVGFLTTALPRFLGTEPAKISELILPFFSAILFVISSTFLKWTMAQASFLVMMASVIVFLLSRFPKRKKTPPPPFLLLGFGMLHALLGPALILWSGFGEKNWTLFNVGRQMVQLGFLLCMVLGVTGHLAPYLMGYTEEPGCDEKPDAWINQGARRIAVHGVAGLFVLGSFLLEPVYPRFSAVVRAAVVNIHLLAFARIARLILKKAVYARLFTWSCRLIPAGLWLVALFPKYRVAGLHLVFIGGFSLMIFSFGMLVVLSHSAQAALLNGPLVPLRIVGYAVLAAAGIRVVADVVPLRYPLLIHLSSGTWVMASLLWLVYVFPKLWRIPYPETKVL